MIESLLKQTPSISNDEADGQDDCARDFSRLSDAEVSILSALSAVQKIVRRKTSFSERTDGAADLVQAVALRLWKWRDKFREKSEKMSPDEWNSFAARTAYNEINRHFSGKAFLKEIPLDDMPEIASQKRVEGDTEAEVFSLVREVWQEICRLTLRQRRALLLHNRQLIIYFLHGGITDEELMRVLEFDRSRWADAGSRLPLSDASIARLASEEKGGKKSVESLTKSIKKARHEARVRLQKITRR